MLSASGESITQVVGGRGGAWSISSSGMWSGNRFDGMTALTDGLAEEPGGTIANHLPLQVSKGERADDWPLLGSAGEASDSVEVDEFECLRVSRDWTVVRSLVRQRKPSFAATKTTTSPLDPEAIKRKLPFTWREMFPNGAGGDGAKPRKAGRQDVG